MGRAELLGVILVGCLGLLGFSLVNRTGFGGKPLSIFF